MNSALHSDHDRINSDHKTLLHLATVVGVLVAVTALLVVAVVSVT